jgi:hypothetical protein
MNVPMVFVNQSVKKLTRALVNLSYLQSRFDELKISHGLILSELQCGKTSRELKDYEFRVFSQWGEDGILQKLTRSIEIKNKTFVEFGVETFFQSNCRFLMMKDNWSGFVIDGSKGNIDRLKTSYFFWTYDLQAVDAFITRDNINDLLRRSGFEEDLGILSVDIDGVDYWVLEKITTFKPRIMILEYNAVFGATRTISVPYEDDFHRTTKHHSNLYFGASLGALVHLANQRGYTFVGTNSAGVNAFFVRNDLMNERFNSLTAETGFTPSKFKESRDMSGNLTHIAGEARLREIQGLPVINVVTNTLEVL